MTSNAHISYSMLNHVEGNQFNINSADQTLLRLEPMRMDASIRPECLTGTRVGIVDAIRSWVFLRSERAQVFWLYGLAGSGKSTIATTIANFFRGQNRLGAFVFCNRHLAERNEPSNVIRNIAYRLALFDPRIRDAITVAIHDLPTIAESPLRLQFDKLILEPLRKLPSTECPIIIVLDALDECGNTASRIRLLALLAEESARLPPFIRVLVTSRPEKDIRIAFIGRPHVTVHEIDIASESNREDVAKFLRQQMTDIRAANPTLLLAPDWPGNSAIYALANRASGLFIWASTACRFINAHKPQKRLDILLRGDVNAEPELALDALYKTALEATGILDDDELCSDFRAVMGIVLVARNPITHQTIDALLSLDSPSLHTIQKLGCVLRWSDTEPVRILHPSFADFLMMQRRCGEALYIDAALHNSAVAISCIYHLNRKGVLKKNVCNMGLSMTPVDNPLPIITSYASVSWIDHVCMIAVASVNLADVLEQFMFQHLLHWLEVMSILKQSRTTIALMKDLICWLRVQLPYRTKLNELVTDASRFVQTFASSIEEHPLLIYLSALPFTPVNTVLFRTFADPSIPWIVGGYHNCWPPLLQMLTGHTGHVHDLAFSPDGMRIASASFDNTIRVWDVSSGVPLLAPLEGHAEFIFAVAFSADGRQIVSGSADNTVRIWDSILGTEAVLILTGHTENVFAVAFAPGGHRVASGSADMTIRVWDTTTGCDIFGALYGHEGQVTAVTFTPDGQLILSGASDNTVCGWNAITGEMTLVLLGHNGVIRSLASSADSKWIVSGSEDGTIRLWDSSTMQELHVLQTPGVRGVKNVTFIPGDKRIASMSIPDCRVRVWDVITGAQTSASDASHGSECMAMSPTGDQFAFAHANTISLWDASFLDHTAPFTTEHHGDICALAPSPDGQRFASISEDEFHIRIWNVETGKEVCSPLRGHNDNVESVAFSSDGELIASGSADTTVIVWDAFSYKEILTLRGHEKAVVSVAFSPDRTQILSGSSDGTVRLWCLSTCTQKLPSMQGQKHIQSVAFHPCGGRIISGCLRGTIWCWDLPSGAFLFKMQFLEYPNVLKSVRFSPNGQLLMASCYGQSGQAINVVASPLTNSIDTDTMMPIAVTPDGWIHDFKTHCLIGKLPSIVSIPVYSSSSSSIVFAPRGRQSSLYIMRFPSSDLTVHGTSQLASLYSGHVAVNLEMKTMHNKGSTTGTW